MTLGGRELEVLGTDGIVLVAHHVFGGLGEHCSCGLGTAIHAAAGVKALAVGGVVRAGA